MTPYDCRYNTATTCGHSWVLVPTFDGLIRIACRRCGERREGYPRHPPGDSTRSKKEDEA